MIRVAPSPAELQTVRKRPREKGEKGVGGVACNSFNFFCVCVCVWCVQVFVSVKHACLSTFRCPTKEPKMNQNKEIPRQGSSKLHTAEGYDQDENLHTNIPRVPLILHLRDNHREADQRTSPVASETLSILQDSGLSSDQRVQTTSTRSITLTFTYEDGRKKGVYTPWVGSLSKQGDVVRLGQGRSDSANRVC